MSLDFGAGISLKQTLVLVFSIFITVYMTLFIGFLIKIKKLASWKQYFKHVGSAVKSNVWNVVEVYFFYGIIVFLGAFCLLVVYRVSESLTEKYYFKSVYFEQETLMLIGFVVLILLALVSSIKVLISSNKAEYGG